MVTSGSGSFGKLGAESEHWLQRCVQGYDQHADQDRLRQRIAELNGQRRWMARSPEILNKEALRTAHGAPFGGMVHVLRKRWRIQSVKINGTAANPPAVARWKLLGPGRGRGHRHHTSSHIRLAPKRVVDRHATRQGHAVADRTIHRPGRRAQSKSPTHQPVQDRGIMKASIRRRSLPIRRSRGSR